MEPAPCRFHSPGEPQPPWHDDHHAPNFHSRAAQSAIEPTAPSHRAKASLCLCQGVWPVFFAAREVVFERWGFTAELGLVAFPAAECGRRLAAPPGRSSWLRCGRSTWTCGVAGGRVAAAGERPALPRILAAVVGWWRGPGVACPKSRCAGCEPAALESESFPGCPPGPFTPAAARRAPAWRRAKMASLICRFSARKASLRVLPSASFLSK